MRWMVGLCVACGGPVAERRAELLCEQALDEGRDALASGGTLDQALSNVTSACGEVPTLMFADCDLDGSGDPNEPALAARTGTAPACGGEWVPSDQDCDDDDDAIRARRGVACPNELGAVAGARIVGAEQIAIVAGVTANDAAQRCESWGGQLLFVSRIDPVDTAAWLPEGQWWLDVAELPLQGCELYTGDTLFGWLDGSDREQALASVHARWDGDQSCIIVDDDATAPGFVCERPQAD